MKIGTGWPLGWTQQQTDDTDIDVIVDAYESSLDMLRWATGKPPPPETIRPAAPSAGTPMTPKLIMAMFGKKING